MTLDHPIFTRWPAQYPDRLQLFSLPTPNGVKVGIMLEETSLAYEPHRIDIMADESHDPAFLALNPNGKIPAIHDPDGPSGTPLALFESGAILLYLGDKTGQFISADPNTRYETIQWVRRCRPAAGVAQPWPRAAGGAARAASDGGLERVCLRLLRGVIRDGHGGSASGCWPMSSRAIRATATGRAVVVDFEKRTKQATAPLLEVVGRKA